MKTMRLAAALILATATMWGQTDTAALSGRITDNTGGSVVGANISVLNSQTGTTVQTVTNQAGLYTFSALAPGVYTLTARASGFEQVKREGIILHVADRINQDFSLTVGSSTQTITVQAESAQVNTESAAAGTVVSRDFIANMPLNGRSFQSLIALTPSAVITPVSSGSPGQFSMNGQRPDSNYFTVDGVSANVGVGAGAATLSGANGSGIEPSAAGGFSNIVSLDAMQEFKVQTSMFAPEFGRTPGGQVSIVTRSGTNQFHGDAFDYLRNNVLDANDWFLNGLPPRTGIPTHPPERQNDFGGVFGGPILKNKLFFFGSYEGVRLVQPTPLLKQVPSLCARGEGPCPAGASPAVPAVRPALDAFPLPTASGCGSALPPSSDPLLSPLCQGFPSTITADAYSIRLDYYVTSKLNSFFRYVNSPSTAKSRGNGNFNQTSVLVTQPGWTSYTGGAVYIPSPSVVNDFRLNYSQAVGYAYSDLDAFAGAVPIPNSNPILLPQLTLPNIGPVTPSINRFFINYTPAAQWREGLETNNKARQWNYVDSLNYTHGSHQIKVGVDFRRVTPIQARSPYQQSYTFSTTATMNKGVANTYASLINPYTITLYHNLSLYAQDTWKVTSRLTITYGLRWEYNPAPGALNNVPDLGFSQLTYANLAGTQVAPLGTPIYSTQWNAFAPRAGIAYQLPSRSGWLRVIRGGFGVFYDTSGDFSQNSTLNGAGGNQSNVSFPATSTQQNPYNTNPNPNQAPWPYVLAPSPNLRMPRTYQMNVAVEQALGTAQTLTVTYAGAIGRNLFLQQTFAPPNANLPQGFEAITNEGTSDYHSLQVLFQRQLAKGLQALASYTWAHSMDNGSNAGYTMPNDLIELPSNERASSDFDVRHAFQGAVTYDIPSHYESRLLKRLLGGWGTDFMLRARTALPINITDTAVYFSQFLPGAQVAERPNIVAGQPLFLYGPACAAAYQIAACAGGKGVNKAALAVPLAGIQGDLPRNALRNFGWAQLDFTLRREFRIHESVALQFRADVFNVTNTPFFSLSGNSLNLANAAFGVSSSMLDNSLISGSATGFNPLYQIGGPRSMQLSLKLVF